MFYIPVEVVRGGQATSASRAARGDSAPERAVAVDTAVALALPALADTPYEGDTASTSFIKLLTERLDFTINAIPSLVRYLGGLPDLVPGRTWALLAGIVVVGASGRIGLRRCEIGRAHV